MSGQAGRVTGSRRPPGPVRQVHLTATLTAVAPYQVQRGRTGPGGLRLRHEDLRETRREGREGNLVLFLVDASGSMAARARMGAVKGAVLSLLLDAYQRRDKVGMITFFASETAFFSTLIVTYLIFLGHNAVGPTPDEVFSMPLSVISAQQSSTSTRSSSGPSTPVR